MSQSWGHSCKDSAIDVLPKMVEQSNERATLAVYACLENEHVVVRHAAVKALPKLILKGDAFSTNLALEHLSHVSMIVRLSVIRALPQLVAKGSKSVLFALRALLQDEDEDVRFSSFVAFVDLAEASDSMAIACEMLIDAEFWIRAEAIKCLTRVGIRGQPEVITAASVCLEHANPDIRRSGLEVLFLFADIGNEHCVGFALACLHDNVTLVRRDALQTIAHLAIPGDERAIAATKAYMTDEDEDVSRAACLGLKKLMDGSLPQEL